jgi:hypothetical protein
MTSLHARLVCVAALLLAAAFPARGQAARWTPVPGAPEVLLDLPSVQFRGALVRAWVKNLPGPLALQAVRAAASGEQALHHRSAVLAQFDCQARTLQILGTIAHDAAGKPLASASLPGRAAPVPREDAIGWVYDALCEGARAIP